MGGARKAMAVADSARSPREVPGPRETALRARILLVDDDESAGGALEALLRADGFSVSFVPDGETAVAEARRTLPDVVLTDLHMPTMDGVSLCKRLHELDGDLPVIVMTADGDRASVIQGLRAGLHDYLIKPLDYGEVQWCVDRALEQRGAKRERERLRLQTEELHRALNERLVLSSIREQEHAEVEAEQRAQLNALLENLSEGVMIVDRSSRVVMVNSAARAILGLGDSKLDGIEQLHTREAHDLQRRPLHSSERPLSRALRGEQFVDEEILRMRPDGQWRRLCSTGTSVRDASGEVALAIVVFRDVTELRRLEQQREEYLALVSHDLRNPLSTLMMSVSLLKRSMDEKGLAQESSIVARAERSANRMKLMIEELTEATTLEAGGVTLHREACDLRELVVAVVGRLDEARACRITIEAEGASPYLAVGDASRLERVIANLLTNALKYSADDAPVTVRLTRRTGSIELDVIDRGIGIAPESLKLLFERYFRTAAGKAHASGLGLGLYIARLITEAHGGRIEVSSEVGKGSTFRLVLPA